MPSNPHNEPAYGNHIRLADGGEGWSVRDHTGLMTNVRYSSPKGVVSEWSYTYDENGMVASMTYPDGTVTYIDRSDDGSVIRERHLTREEAAAEREAKFDAIIADIEAEAAEHDTH